MLASEPQLPHLQTAMKAKDIYQVLFLFWCVNVLLHVCLYTA